VATRTPPEARTLTLGPAAPTTRRAVGSIAWCVLEHLAENAEDRAGATVSYESVRSAAGAVGYANDTVARALRRLADAGLITYVPSHSVNGRFSSSHYRLTFPADVFIGLPVPTPAASANRDRRSSSRQHPADATQLSLIDALQHTS
jgi:hypothetical protein